MADPYSLYFARQTPYVGASHGGSSFQTGLNAPLVNVVFFNGTGEWYRDVSGLSVNSNDATWKTDQGAQFYSNEAGGWQYPTNGAANGIPYWVVDSNATPMVPVVMGDNGSGAFLDESDIVWAPLPVSSAADAAVEGYPANPLWPSNPETGSDQHLIVLDLRKSIIYEMWRAMRRVDHWYCVNIAVWDLTDSEVQRPFTQTSADVAGLSIMAGLLLGCQVTAAAIDHAMRFTTRHNTKLYLSPNASHAQSSSTSANVPPFGARMRLKASISEVTKPGGGSWNTNALTLVRAWKKWGLINADTGTPIAGQGDTSNWDYANGQGGPAWQDLHLLQTSDFEFVDTGATQYDETGALPPGAAPTASLTVSSGEVNTGTQITLTPTWTGKTLACLHPVGGAMKSQVAVVDTPTRDQCYMLDVGNPYGRVRKFQRVIVTNGAQAYPSFDRYISPTGSNSNDGLTTGTPWALSALVDQTKTQLIAGYVIGLMDGTYDVSAATSSTDSLYEIPTGIFGKPTVIQAVNSRLPILSSGANAKPIFGSNYQGFSALQFRGLKFVTTGGAFNMSFYGSPEGGLLVNDCEFSGFTTAAIKLDGNPTGYFAAFLNSCVCHNASGTYFTQLQWAHDTHIRNLSLDVHGAGSAPNYQYVWQDFGNNTNTVVD